MHNLAKVLHATSPSISKGLLELMPESAQVEIAQCYMDERHCKNTLRIRLAQTARKHVSSLADAVGIADLVIASYSAEVR